MSVSYGIGKRDHPYARTIADIDAPKTVFMAITVALALQLDGTGNIDSARQRVMDEWVYLHANGIVPQKPRKK